MLSILTNVSITGVVIGGIVLVVGLIICWFYFRRGGEEYEYTEDYLNNIAEFRDGTLTAIANTIIGQMAMFSPEDGPKLSCYQSGENTSLVRLEFMSDREVSFEVDWETNKVYMIMQKTITGADAECEIIKHSKTFSLVHGAVVDKDIIIHALNKWETKIFDIGKAHLEEIIETVAESGDVYGKLNEQQRREVIFSVIADVCNIMCKNRRCSKKEFNVLASKLFAYVLTAHKEEFLNYLYGEQSEGISPVAPQSDEENGTIEK